MRCGSKAKRIRISLLPGEGVLSSFMFACLEPLTVSTNGRPSAGPSRCSIFDCRSQHVQRGGVEREGPLPYMRIVDVPHIVNISYLLSPALLECARHKPGRRGQLRAKPCVVVVCAIVQPCSHVQSKLSYTIIYAPVRARTSETPVPFFVLPACAAEDVIPLASWEIPRLRRVNASARMLRTPPLVPCCVLHARGLAGENMLQYLLPFPKRQTCFLEPEPDRGCDPMSHLSCVTNAQPRSVRKAAG